jgi:carboxylesterase
VISERIAKWQSERGEQVTGHASYTQGSLTSVFHLMALLGRMRRMLPQVRAPLLLVHARHDELIPIAQMQRILDAVGSEDKTTFILERGEHVVTEDEDRQVVFEAVSDFIAAKT